MKLGRDVLAAVTPRATKELTCGFCANGTHRFCPRAVANGDRAKIWPCACRVPECGGGSILRCLTCKHEGPGEVSPAMWTCLDPEACQVRVDKRLAANPGYQQIKEFTMPKATAVAKATPRQSKPKAEPRDCADGCGSKTGGGLFLPGHDAKLLSVKVKEVGAQKFTQAAIKAAAQDLRTRGASDTLINKFSQRVTIAKAKAAAEATKPAKAAAAPVRPAAKKAAAKKVAPGKPASNDDDEDGADF